MYIIYDKKKADQNRKSPIYEDWAESLNIDLSKPFKVFRDEGYKWICETPVGARTTVHHVHLGKDVFSLAVPNKSLEDYL